MEFEFDPKKSQANKTKHGIDFYEAQALWDDPDFMEIPAKTSDEPRFIVIGKIEGRYWSGVVTHRGEKIRIISVRRSRKEEVDIYESA
ncbi:MAG: BrnT family toxin [Candidatus Tectomicrobia bacterium]|uniref:BrnT family toxin n=1 Tax=Tectimicrobiota bacterium TaxID=2528274 RepID=A0A932M2K3_UNCTE|nr:BrnT family toxin [Candidatus Tectomicrobia bacterium]